jgi:hypothetical protein
MPLLMILYGLGFAAIFGVYALMYLRAWSLRDALQLDAAERAITRSTIRAHGISAAFGLVSAAMCWLDQRLTPAAGWLYFGLGPVHALHGWRSGVAVERLPARG